MSALNLNLDSPVGHITLADASSKMITRPAETPEDCVKFAQKLGACGEKTDWCYYHSFRHNDPKTVHAFGKEIRQSQPGTCFMGPDKGSAIDLSLNPTVDGKGGLPLYITPSSKGDTAEQKYLNTTKQLIRRSQAQLQNQISVDTKKNKGNEVSLKILQNAIESGQSFSQAKEEYELNLSKVKRRDIEHAQTRELQDVHKNLTGYAAKRNLQKEILLGKDAVLTERDLEVTRKENEADSIQSKIVRIGQDILNYQQLFDQKSKMVQLLMLTLFVLTIFAFLLFTYYGVKVARNMNNTTAT